MDLVTPARVRARHWLDLIPGWRGDRLPQQLDGE